MDKKSQGTVYNENASLNRWVLSWVLNVVMESDRRICSGREFQSLGAEQLKARAPMVLRRELGTVRSPYGRRVEGAGGGVLLKEVGDVDGG